MDLRKQVLLKKPLSEISLNSSNISVYESAAEDSDSESFYYSFTDNSDSNFDLSPPKKVNNSEVPEDHENSLVSSPEDKNDTIINVEALTPRKTAIVSDVQIIVTEYDENVKHEEVEEVGNVQGIQVETAGDNIEVVDDNVEIVESPSDQLDENPSNTLQRQNTALIESNVHQVQEISLLENIAEPEDMLIDEPNSPEKDIVVKIEETDQIDDIQEPEDMAMAMELDTTCTTQNNEDPQEQKSQREIIIEAPISSVEIHFHHDPNKSLVNPFLLGADLAESPVPSTSDENTQVKKNAKKSATKIPTKTHLYSPLQRKSIDRNTKIIIKPTAARRTVYETRSQTTIPKKQDLPKVKPPSTSAVSKIVKSTESKLTKPSSSNTTLKKPTVTAPKISKPLTAAENTKPTTSTISAPKRRVISVPTFKCTFEGCNREFRSGPAFRDHMKSHNGNISASTSASNSSASLTAQNNKCKWCDKKFEISSALISHMIESCTKISFAEKRKLLAEQERNKPPNNKRKSMFAAPEPVARKRSPSRRQTIVSRKSRVVTPKKTMKCHVEGCGQLFTEVLAFANHMVSHKYEGVLPAAK